MVPPQLASSHTPFTRESRHLKKMLVSKWIMFVTSVDSCWRLRLLVWLTVVKSFPEIALAVLSASEAPKETTIACDRHEARSAEVSSWEIDVCWELTPPPPRHLRGLCYSSHILVHGAVKLQPREQHLVLLWAPPLQITPVDGRSSIRKFRGKKSSFLREKYFYVFIFIQFLILYFKRH